MLFSTIRRGGNGSGGCRRSGRQLLRLKFRPNRLSAYSTRTGFGRHGWIPGIDPVARRIGKESTGLIPRRSRLLGNPGSLDKGRTLFVEQRNGWQRLLGRSHMSLSFTGKICCSKSLAMKSDEVFQRLPNPCPMTPLCPRVEILKGRGEAGAKTGKLNGDIENKSTRTILMRLREAFLRGRSISRSGLP